jgi:uncharacterized protein with HEPN domain
MSSKNWAFRIQDILISIEKIQRYAKGMNWNQFKKNELVIDAIIRNLEIIGEATKNIPLSFRRSHPDIPWNEMSGMRNILIHEYSGVDVKIIWHTTKKYLPLLQKQLENLIVESD